MNSWLESLLEAHLRLLEFCDSSHELLVPVLNYTSKFVTRRGARLADLFNLMLTAAVVAMKTVGPDNQTPMAEIASVSGTPVEQLQSMEREFLGVIDWQLGFDDMESRKFMRLLAEAA